MSNKILFDGQTPGQENSGDPAPAPKEQVRPNIFQGRTEQDHAKAQFPDWDIVPPNQFINPRIKKQ